MTRLQGKVALVTGGNSGIGLAAAQQFLQEGAARVVITGRNAAAVREATATLGERALGLVADVSQLDELDRLAREVREQVGALDVLFVNAGTAEFSPVDSVTETHFNKIFDTNVKGAYFTIQKLLPVLRDGASVVLNGSVNAYVGMAGASIYSASKAALHSFAKTLSADLLARRIRVNVVSPGPIQTPLFGKVGIPAEHLPAVAAGIQSQVKLNRFGLPEEIARVATFLASDDSSFMIGAEVVADGGFSTL